MIINVRSFDCQTNSPSEFQKEKKKKKRVPKETYREGMENMDTYVMVQRGLHHILIPKIKENIEHTLKVLL